jgi:hypothetical protein
VLRSGNLTKGRISMTGHSADNWISNAWLGRIVRQLTSCDGPSDAAIGRESKVVATYFDETGALHIATEDGYFCPASRLEIVDAEPLAAMRTMW